MGVLTYQRRETGFDLFLYPIRRIAFFDLKGAVQKIDQGKIGDILAVRIGVSFQPLNLIPIQAFPELIDQPAFAGSRRPVYGKYPTASLR